MRENRINWPQFFRPVCVLCMVCGGLWLWWQMSLTENLLGRITAIAGGVLFLLGGLFGLLGKPRALVPLLDFLALAASLIALWKIGLCMKVGCMNVPSQNSPKISSISLPLPIVSSISIFSSRHTWRISSSLLPLRS